MPPQQRVALLEASKEMMQAWLEQGRMECAYGFPTGGGFCIGSYDSHEALMDTLLEYPHYPLMDWEITPLVDADYGFDKFIEYFKKQIS
jgi:hypothetical protein